MLAALFVEPPPIKAGLPRVSAFSNLVRNGSRTVRIRAGLGRRFFANGALRIYSKLQRVLRDLAVGVIGFFYQSEEKRKLLRMTRSACVARHHEPICAGYLVNAS
jgi:hypothetical protein